MATKSVPPPNPVNEIPQNPVSEVAQPVIKDSQAVKDLSPPSVFVNSEPMREDQVQNAVKFLSHPRVMGSPVIYRRSFLERKGLTKEEIDEAFCRVPDPTPAVSSGQLAVANQDGQSNSSSNIQQAASNQVQLPATTTISNLGTLGQHRFGWQQALLALGLLAISGAGTAVIFKNAIVPRLKSWIRKVVSEEDDDLVKKTNTKPSLTEETVSAAKAAAADVVRASQEMLNLKSGEKRYFEELMSLLDRQVQEMKSMNNAIRNLEGKRTIFRQEDNRVSVISSKPSYPNGKADFLSSQPVPNPRVAPKSKPWEVGQVLNTSSQFLQSQGNGNVVNQLNGDGSVPWWQQKNVRISEIESGDEYSTGSSGGPTTMVERPIQRSWVPPQPPPVAMAEAAAAIRQPKKSAFLSESSTDDQFLARSSELTDELQRITKISESGGVTEANGGSAVLNTDIQTEDGNSYFET